MGNPAADQLGCARLLKFVGHGLGNEYFRIEDRQQFHLADQDQVAHRGGIGNDDTRHGSEVEPAVSLPILFQIPPGVFQPDFVLLQEAVELVARFKPQEAPELGGRKLAFAISFKGDGFKGGAGKVIAGCRQSSGKLVRQLEGDPHGPSIAESCCRHPGVGRWLGHDESRISAFLPDLTPSRDLERGGVVDTARDLIRLSGYVPDKDIAIEFTGIRPSEKLFEELVGDGEFAEPSSIDKVLRVQTAAPPCRDGLADAISRLEELALDGRSDEVLRGLSALLADFTPTRAETSPA